MNSRILSLIARRLVVMLTTLLIVSFIVFSATSLLPGDTATILLGQSATPEAVAGLRTAMHLDDPALYASCAGFSACFTASSAHPMPTIWRLPTLLVHVSSIP